MKLSRRTPENNYVSLQNDNKKLLRGISVQPANNSMFGDAFGPHLSAETMSTLPGTPLPSLLPGGESNELIDVDLHDGGIPTPPDEEEVHDNHFSKLVYINLQ